MADSVTQAKQAYAKIVDILWDRYQQLDNQHSVELSDEETAVLCYAKMRLFKSTTKKYIRKIPIEELAALYRSCLLGKKVEEGFIRRRCKVPSPVRLPEREKTPKYIVYSKICRHAPNIVVKHLKSLCKKDGCSTNLFAVAGTWTIECKYQGYYEFSLKRVLNSKGRCTRKDYDTICSNIRDSNYPESVKRFSISQLDYILL